MGIPIGGGGGGGGDPTDPGLTCAQAKAQIASLTLTVANLTSLLARTQDPVQRADIQQGIRTAQQELAVLRSELPLICAPPPPKPSIPVLIVLDGTDASFQNSPGSPDGKDDYFTLSYFQSVLETQGVTTPLLPFAITKAHRQVDPGSVSTVPVINNAFFTWKSSTLPPGVTGKSVIDLSFYQVVFLFGFQGFSSLDASIAWDGDGNPGQEQLWAFVQFMNNGGGLFAAGDHEDLGAPLCAAIPRVRSMRRWLWQVGDNPYPQNDDGTPPGSLDEGGEEVNPVTADPSDPSGFTGYDANFFNNVELIHPHNTSQGAQLGMKCAPPALGTLRHDTLQAKAQDITLKDPVANETLEQPGQSVPGDISTPFIPFDRQSDDTPQPVTLTSSVMAQQLFTMPSGGQLAAYPDHMHEGVAIDLSDTTNPDPRTVTYVNQGVTIPEYPQTQSAGQPVPQVLMTLTTTAGHATPTGELFHIGALDETGTSVQFGGVSAYDGRPVSVGRIVTDSTFHHFVDINVTGDTGMNVPAYAVQGFNSSATGQSYLAQFAQYWINLVNWLLPATAAAPLLMAAVDHARTSVSVRMSAGPGVAAHGEAVHGLGEIVTQLVDRHLPAPLLRDAVQHAMPAAHAQGVADWLASTRAGQPDAADAVDRALLHGFMGGAVLHVLGLPKDQSLVADVAAVGPDVVHAGLRGAAKALTASRHQGIAQDLIALLDE
jgi:hypothetical protein